MDEPQYYTNNEFISVRMNHVYNKKKLDNISTPMGTQVEHYDD